MKPIEILSTKDIDRDMWLEARRNGIGGSDVSAILGVNPYRTAMDVWLEKTGQFIEDVDNEAMYFGRALEDFVAQEFTKRMGFKTRRKNALLQHHAYPFMLANVDRLVVGEKAGLECKTTSSFYADEGTCPIIYYAQVQHYMLVTGLELWYVAILAGGQRFYIYAVPRNHNYIDNLIEKETEFWGLVQTEVPPEFDGSEASTNLLGRLYPEGDSSTLELPMDAFGFVEQYEEYRALEKEAGLKKDEAANRLKGMLGTAEMGSIYDRRVCWTNVAQERLDIERIRQELPEVYAKCLKRSTFRRFSIK